MAGTVTEVSPTVNKLFVARSMVKPVSTVPELSSQLRITERVLLEFGPFTALKELGGNGWAGTVTLAVFEGVVESPTLFLDHTR